MSAVRQRCADYLATRRALGHVLRQEGRLLASFVDYLERAGVSGVTVAAALAWATQPVQAGPSWWAKRLTVVRGFARYLHTFDPDTEIPPVGLLPRGVQRTTPYLFSPEEITALMGAARRLATPLRAATFETLIGLMAVTGLRTGETMRLDRGDVDFDAGVLVVHDSKFGKHRLVPLHPTTTAALTGYARRRDQLCPRPVACSFFVSGAGTRLNHTNVSTTFTRLLDAAGIGTPPGRRRPRPYDLRHSFTVATLVTWYQQDVDVARRLPALSTYLGHDKPATTYWYLQAAPELMALAAGRVERSLEGGLS